MYFMQACIPPPSKQQTITVAGLSAPTRLSNSESKCGSQTSGRQVRVPPNSFSLRTLLEKNGLQYKGWDWT